MSNHYFVHLSCRCGTAVFYFAEKGVAHLQPFFCVHFGRADAAVINIQGLHHELSRIQAAHTVVFHDGIICLAAQGNIAHALVFQLQLVGGKVQFDVAHAFIPDGYILERKCIFGRNITHRLQVQLLQVFKSNMHPHFVF